MNPHCFSQPHHRLSRRAGGFTLIEAALATVIIGTGVLSIVAAQQAYHRKNDWAQRTGTAMLLANEIRELSLSMPVHDPITGSTNLGPESNEIVAGSPDVSLFDDLDDFAGTVDATGKGTGMTISPPINALRQPVADMARWSQRIMVERVWEDYINAPSGPTLPALDTLIDAGLGKRTVVRMTVDILYNDPVNGQKQVTSLSWIVTQ